MSYPPPGDQNQPPQYPTNQPPPSGPANQPPPPPGGTPGGYNYPPPNSGDYGYDGYAAHIERPGVVTAGSVIAIVLSALSALAAVASIIGVIAAWDSMVDELRSDPDTYNITTEQINNMADAKAGIIVALVVWLAVAVFGVFLGMLTMKGQNWARITLVVFAAITALVALVLITSFVSAIWLIGAIASIICVFVGGANDWFRYQADQRRRI